jgi:hypothetical protein
MLKPLCTFKRGDRVELIAMPNDPNPIAPGTQGTVWHDPVWVFDTWTIGVKWDNGGTLNLVVPPDRARIIALGDVTKAQSGENESDAAKS